MKISRIFSMACLLLALTVSAGHAATVIKIAHPNVPSHPEGQAFELFKTDLEKRSNGAFKVQIYDSSKYGNFDAVVQGLQMGVLQIGADASTNFTVFNPKLLMFDMPWLIPDYESSDLITDGPLGQELTKALQKNNITCLGYIEIGFRNIFSSRPIRTLEDAKGLKIRSTASKAHIAILKALGMNPTPVAWGEVYTALQQKTVDAIDIDLNLAYFNKFPEITKYVTMTKSFYSPHMVLVSNLFWNKLSEQEKTWVRESFAVMQKFERETIRKNEDMIKQKLVENGGEIIELSPEERQRWVEATKNIYQEFSDDVPAEVIQEIKDTVAGKK